MEVVVQEFIRALRGRRSQVALSRRLGFRSNVVAKWEGGSRIPTAKVALQACEKVGIDVSQALAAFHQPTSHLLNRITDGAIASWLRSQRGDQPIVRVAERAGCSRYQVTRCLSGKVKPSLAMFLRLIDALTGRLPEMVATLVDIERIPSLYSVYRRQEASRNCAYTHPWSSAVLAIIDTAKEVLPCNPREQSVRIIADKLGISRELVQQSLEALKQAGVIQCCNGYYKVASNLLTDTRRNPEMFEALCRHWAHVSALHLEAPSTADQFNYNVFSVSHEDYQTIRNLQLDFYQGVRAIVAESEPSEVTALMTLHLMQFGGDSF